MLASIDWSIFSDLTGIIHESTLIRVLLALWIGLILQFVIQFAIGKMINRVVARMGNLKPADAEKQKHTLKGVLNTMAAVILWIIIVFVIIAIIGIDIGALLAGAGLFGIIFGFGAQSIVKDFVSGLFIIGENQYRVGDIVDIVTPSGIVSGVVEDLTIRITRLRDLDGNSQVVSNGMAQSITNYSYQYAHVNIDVRVAYDSDIDKVEKIINEVGLEMEKDDRWKNLISEPVAFFRVDRFEDFGIVVKALGVVHPGHQWEIGGDFRRRILKEFSKKDIKIPLPQIEVSNHKETRSR